MGVQVGANATIGTNSYQAQADTDTNGNYSLNVANGNWSVYVSCQGGDESLEEILGNDNYACPNNQNVNIVNNNGVVNFTVQPCMRAPNPCGFLPHWHGGQLLQRATPSLRLQYNQRFRRLGESGVRIKYG